MATTEDRKTARALKKLGIKIPLPLIKACGKTGIPLSLGAALLVQESGGGANVWGHDPTIFVGGHDKKNDRDWGSTVTEDAYREYLAQRGPTGKGGMQGVGPCQLTWWEFQDQADDLGGCWDPYHNITVGFTILARNIKAYGEHEGVARYNGTGSAAQRYADEVLARAAKFETELGSGT